MSEIEEILNKAKITFSNPLSFADTERLLFCISEGIQGEVHYSLDWPKSFVYDETGKKSKIKEGDTIKIELDTVTKDLVFSIAKAKAKKADEKKDVEDN